MGIINTIYRGALTLNALSLMVLIYIVKSPELNNIIVLDYLPLRLFIGIGFVIFSLVITKYLLVLQKHLSRDDVNNISSTNSADSKFLPVYLGYFFVALSLPDWKTFSIVFVILFILIFISQTEYYNPLFYFFGYRFYTVTYSRSMKIYLISNVDIIHSDSQSFENIRRINDYTYILTEVEDDKPSDSKSKG